MYPVPAKDVVYVSFSNDVENISWKLVNMQGQVIKKMDESTCDFEIDLDNINNGIYFLNVTVDDKLMVKKIVVE